MNDSGKSPQTLEFKADLRQVLDIITHSLYSHREVFLRELISNASDAIDKLRFEALTNPTLLERDFDFEIELRTDRDDGTLTIADNGIGMTREGLVDELGTIARSGTKEFLARLAAAEASEKPELIGQFGVGFYSSFMVAERVDVISRRAGEDEAVRWSSSGEGEFTLEPTEKEGHGTDIVLHLREDAKEFLEPLRLRALVKKYSDYIEYPIVTMVEREEDGETKLVKEIVNSQKAIWLRNPSDVSDEEYNNFYKQIAHDFQDPLKTIHYSAEGTLEFTALLYLPTSRPWDQVFADTRSGLHLYIQRVFVMNNCEDLLPEYLRFVQGVVDCADLPLNVSRELLQENPLVAKIRSNLTKKVLRTLSDMKSNDRVEYEKFFREFGPILKEGVARDLDHKDEITELLLFESTKTEPGETTTLEHYVATMPDDQEAIYYLIGEDRALLEQSPYLESFREDGIEVLLLVDPIDEFLVQSLPVYKDKPLKAVDRGDIQLKAAGEVDEEAQKELTPLFGYLAEKIDEVKEVRLSQRLKSSASCLVVDEGALGAHMERLLEKMGRADDLPTHQRILELNGQHPAVIALKKLYEADAFDTRVEDYGRLLYDQAVLAEGSTVKDPAAFARRINQLIADSAQA